MRFLELVVRIQIGVNILKDIEHKPLYLFTSQVKYGLGRLLRALRKRSCVFSFLECAFASQTRRKDALNKASKN